MASSFPSLRIRLKNHMVVDEKWGGLPKTSWKDIDQSSHWVRRSPAFQIHLHILFAPPKTLPSDAPLPHASARSVTAGSAARASPSSRALSWVTSGGVGRVRATRRRTPSIDWVLREDLILRNTCCESLRGTHVFKEHMLLSWGTHVVSRSSFEILKRHIEQKSQWIEHEALPFWPGREQAKENKHNAGSKDADAP